ncbi:restriction endonuclease subunit S [Myxococcus virescens]|nr:restriction endonuclease subunit S [Myxococcus virescens]
MWVPFDDVVSIESNLVDPRDFPDAPHIAPNHIESKTGRLLPYVTVAADKVTSPKHRFRSGQILYSKIRPYLAKAVLADFEGLCSADMYPLSTWLESGFLLRWLLSDEFTARVSLEQGRTVLPKVNQTALGKINVPVPPRNEQRRIVAKLEALLARSRRAKGALDVVPSLLEQFRQSVLAAAFRGDLTRDWREKNPDVEPASKFLERIRTERRHRWEEAELKRMQAKGKVPKDEQWKTKYEAPAQIDDSGLQALPSGWAWASIEEVCPLDAPVVYGIILPGDDVQGGVPYIRPVDMNSDGTIDFTSMKRTSSSIAAQYQRASLRGGDIVLSIVGTIGKVIVVPDELDGGNITQSSARLRPPEWLSGEYLRLALLSSTLRSQYDKFRFGNAVQRLNIEHVRRLAIPIAPAEEMKFIVTRATAALARAEQVQIVEQRQQFDKFEQSILAKAFRGELVSQDPTDEPASALIDRIRAQREMAEQQQMPARSKRRRETTVA